MEIKRKKIKVFDVLRLSNYKVETFKVNKVT